MNEKSDIDEKDLLVTKQNSEVYDRDGQHLATLSVDEKRKIITLSDMSKYIPEAYISMEDERFYNHMGVDFQRTASAMLTYVTHKGKSSYGASTITQQLISVSKLEDVNFKYSTYINEKEGVRDDRIVAKGLAKDPIAALNRN